MDMQTTMIKKLSNVDDFTANVAKAITHARKKGILIIYVVIGFRPGAPERKKPADRDKWTAELSEDFIKIHPAVAPVEKDITVIKKRMSAFTGSDLEIIIRSQGITHLILSGYATSGVVLSTVREAADKDYRLTVLADCCANSDAEVHNILINKVFPRQATVLAIEEWTKII